VRINKNISVSFKLSKGFIALAFLLSVFSFNGFAGNFLAKENKTAQTEVVISTISRTTKHAVHYKHVVSTSGEISVTSFKTCIFEYNRLVNIQLKRLIKQESIPIFLLSHHKLFPTDQNEIPANAFIKG